MLHNLLHEKFYHVIKINLAYNSLLRLDHSLLTFFYFDFSFFSVMLKPKIFWKEVEVCLSHSPYVIFDWSISFSYVCVIMFYIIINFDLFYIICVCNFVYALYILCFIPLHPMNGERERKEFVHHDSWVWFTKWPHWFISLKMCFSINSSNWTFGEWMRGYIMTIVTYGSS